MVRRPRLFESASNFRFGRRQFTFAADGRQRRISGFAGRRVDARLRRVAVARTSLVQNGQRKVVRVIQQDIIGSGLHAHRTRYRPPERFRGRRIERDQIFGGIFSMHGGLSYRPEALVVVVRVVAVQVDQVLRLRFIGRRCRCRLRIGDAFFVIVHQTSVNRRLVDLVVIESILRADTKLLR